jgi:hypothetical protein
MTGTTGTKRFRRQSETTWKGGTALVKVSSRTGSEILLESSPVKSQMEAQFLTPERRASKENPPFIPLWQRGKEGGFEKRLELAVSLLVRAAQPAFFHTTDSYDTIH